MSALLNFVFVNSESKIAYKTSNKRSFVLREGVEKTQMGENGLSQKQEKNSSRLYMKPLQTHLDIQIF